MKDEQFDDRLDAWLCGEMDADEQAAFEAELAADPALRVRAEQARRTMDGLRDWFASEPPGLDRAAAIQPPAPIVPVPVTTRARPRIPAWLQVAAAVALFVAGYAFGQFKETPQHAPQTTAEKNAAPTPDAPASTAPATDSPDSDPADRVVAQASSRPRVTTQQDGRLRVESQGSLWIVDPKFNLTDSPDTTDSKSQQ